MNETNPTTGDLRELERDSSWRWSALVIVALALAAIVALLDAIAGFVSPFPSASSGPILLIGLCVLVVILCIQSLARERDTRRLRQRLLESRLAGAALVREREIALEMARLKTEFLSNVSHELRTPLTGIVGATEVLLSTPLEPRQREFLETSKGCADALLRVVEEILDFSMLESRGIDLDRIPFGLRGCVASVLGPLASRAERKGLELSSFVAGDLPDALVGDPARLREVILHLVGNAIKFTDQGRITIRAARESETDDGLLLRVSVTDTGIGIPSGQQERIFGAFTQADGSMTRAHGGTGLGLAIAARLAEEMGGGIGVESEPGRGSTFWFTARFALGPRSATGGLALPPSALRGRRVMIVDDDPASRKVFAEMLEERGMRPLAVPDAAAAARMLRGEQDAGRGFDLVLLDARTPDTDGLALTGHLRGEPDLAGIPIVVLTSAAQPGDARVFREAGVAGYLPKPVVGSDLLDTIRVVLGREATAAEARPFVTRHWLRENLGRHRVLLVEGTPEARAAIVDLLERRGFLVRSAETADLARSAIEDGDVDIAVLDMESESLDGGALAEALRARSDPSGRRILVVGTDADLDAGIPDRPRAVACDLRIGRPVEAPELLAALDALIAATDAPPAPDARTVSGPASPGPPPPRHPGPG